MGVKKKGKKERKFTMYNLYINNGIAVFIVLLAVFALGLAA